MFAILDRAMWGLSPGFPYAKLDLLPFEPFLGPVIDGIESCEIL